MEDLLDDMNIEKIDKKYPCENCIVLACCQDRTDCVLFLNFMDLLADIWYLTTEDEVEFVLTKLSELEQKKVKVMASSFTRYAGP